MAEFRGKRALRKVTTGGSGGSVLPAAVPVDPDWTEGAQNLRHTVVENLRLGDVNLTEHRLGQCVTNVRAAASALVQLAQYIEVEEARQRAADRASIRQAGSPRQRVEMPQVPIMLAWLSTITAGLLPPEMVADGGDMRPETESEARARVSGYRRDAIAHQFIRAGEGAEEENDHD